MTTIQYAHRPGIRIAYRRYGVGNGPRVLLIHGLGMSSQLWFDQPERIAARGYEVIVLDARGTGQSDVPRPPYYTVDMAEDVASVIAACGGGPMIVAGISLGGMVAQHLVLRHPHYVAGLVLAATTSGALLGQKPNPHMMATMVAGLAGSRRARRRIGKYLVHPHSLRKNPALIQLWHDIVDSGQPSAMVLGAHFCAALLHDTRAHLGKITCPVDVVTGDGDALILPTHSQVLAAKIPTAQLHLLPRLGHAFPLEDADALGHAIDRIHRRLSLRKAA